MAKLYTRQDSRFWWARIRNPAGGKPLREATRFEKDGRSKRETEANRRDAQKWADQREERLCAEGPPFTLGQALIEARKEQEVNTRAESTLDRGRVSGAHLQRVLGWDTNLHRVNPALFTEQYVLTRRAEGVTDHTITKELAFLRLGLGRGKRHELFRGEPSAFKVPALRGCYDPRSRWLPVHELTMLLEAERTASQRYSWAVSRRDWLLGYYFTGARQNELHRIRKEHVSLRTRELYIDGTKTKKSRRTIPILNDLVPVLERRLDTPGATLFAPEWQRGRMHANLKRWTTAAGIAMATANDFRRSFATLMAERHVPEHLTIQYLGHGSSKMVRAVYQQVTERMRADTIDRFGSVLNSCADGVTSIEKAWEYRTPQSTGVR